MPGGYVHLMVTEKALDQFRKEEAVERDMRGYTLIKSQFFQLGCLGSDYPYLDLFQPDQKAWADHMHYDLTGDLLKTIAAKLLELNLAYHDNEDFIIPFCWSLGYISHVTADLVVHPVVANIVGTYTGNEAEHRHCEMVQDDSVPERLCQTQLLFDLLQ